MTNTLRTLQIGNDWPEEHPGGLNRYFADLLHNLPATGTQVHGLVVGSTNIQKMTDGVVESFSRPDELLPLRLARVRGKAHAYIRNTKTDLIVSHFALYAAPLGSILSGTPLVTHFHGPWAAEDAAQRSASFIQGLKQTMESRIYKRSRRLIVLSQSFRDELVTRYGIDEERIRIVPGGVNQERFNTETTRHQAREALGWPTDRQVLLTVRRLVHRMGLDVLLEAFKSVVRSAPDVLLLIGGSGPDAADLQQLIEREGLQTNVRLLGRISEADLPLAYRAADMSIIPSQSLEGFGLITLESLASGTPALVTPVGGLPEIIAPFAPQCIFSGTSAEAMKELLSQVLSGRLLLPSQASCRSYAEAFAWSEIAKKVRAVYDEAV